MELINWKIAAHPMNWVTVFLMVFIGSIALTLILTSFTTPSESA